MMLNVYRTSMEEVLKNRIQMCANSSHLPLRANTKKVIYASNADGKLLDAEE